MAKQKKTLHERGSRKWNIITYVPKNFVLSILNDKKERGVLRYYALIEHDQDIENGSLKEPHLHVILVLRSPSYFSVILNWFTFDSLFDDECKEYNTRCFECVNLSEDFLYLTHESKKAIQEGKHRYPRSQVISNDIRFFLGISADDSLADALTELLNGVPLRTVALSYGRDFIVHYSSLKNLAWDIFEEENHGRYSYDKEFCNPPEDCEKIKGYEIPEKKFEVLK